MRVLRRIRSLVNTHAPQPTPADGSAVVARTGKKSIFSRALQGAAVLGAGLALTVGAAVSPQVAAAVTYGDSLATEGANDWQIVSGQYQGNTDKSNSSDVPADQVSSDDYVRVQKSVVPTDKENEFKVYLSIDKKADAYSEIYSASVILENNNSSGSTIGSVEQINGQYEMEPVEGGNWPFYYQYEITGIDGSVTYSDVIFAGTYGHKAQTAIISPDQELVAGEYGLTAWNIKDGKGSGQSESDPAIFAVDMSDPGYGEIFGTQSVSVRLNKVSDTMGDHIIFGQTVEGDYTGEAPKTDANGILSWTPLEKAGANDDDGDGWIENVAELVYTITLDVTDEGFVSCGLDGSGVPADSDDCRVPTNSEASLNYTMTTTTTTGGGTTSSSDGSITFPSPVVKGLLYDLVGKKTNEGGSPLMGATFGLYEGDAANDPNAQPIATVKSDSNGIVKFTDLEWGDYSVKEIAAPTEEDLPEGTIIVFPYDSSDDVWVETLCYTTSPDGLEKSTVVDCNAMKQRAESFVNLQKWMTSLPLTKYFSGGEWGDGDEFTFSIVPDEGSPSLRDYQGNEVSSITLSKNDAYYDEYQQQWVARTNLFIAGVGTGLKSGESEYYGYTITEIKGDSEGVVYSKAKWYVVFDVGLNEDGTVHAGQESVVQLLDDDGNSLDASTPATRGVIRGIQFINRRVLLTVPGLQETKRVVGGNADEGDFKFSVQAVGHEGSGTLAADAAQLAGLENLAKTLNDGSYNASSQTLTFTNGEGVAVADNAKTVRAADPLTLTAANVGHTYVYEYKELPIEGSAWHQKQETVWRVTVAVDWDDPDTKDAIKAALTLENKVDGGEWTKVSEQTYSSAEGAQNPTDPLTVSFVNEYGSTLEIVKTDQDDNPLAGATFTVTGNDYIISATTELTPENPGEGETQRAVATFENIPDGTYTITETVPAGYQKINDMTLVIDGKYATLKWADTGEDVGEGTIIKDKNGVFTIEVMNYINPDLPSTGSSGTVLMGGLGTAAIVLAGAWLLKQRGIDLGKFSSR